VQRHAARVILGAFKTTRTWMTHAALGWMRVATRIELDTIRLAIRCLAGAAAPIYARAVAAMVDGKLPWGVRLMKMVEKFGLRASWDDLLSCRDCHGVCPAPKARAMKKLAKVKAAELEADWWRAESAGEAPLLLAHLDDQKPSCLRPKPIFAQRVVQSHYVFKFFLPSFIARDRVAKEDGVSTCPLCDKEPDTGDHLLHRCEGRDAPQRKLFSALREEMLAAGGFADLEECLRRMAGEGAAVEVEVADKVSGCLRVLYRQRTMYYRAVRKAAIAAADEVTP
jgi:hypothetical protein